MYKQYQKLMVKDRPVWNRLRLL